jgi:DNA-binding winged helix-turn-helix (wHTH) protein
VRRKLGAAPGEPGPIKTFQGIGYVLDVESAIPDKARPQAEPSDPASAAPESASATASA